MLVHPESGSDVGRSISHDHTAAYGKDISASLVIPNDGIKSDILLGEPVENSSEYRPNTPLPILHGNRVKAWRLT
jgi:hypothetical protein